MTKSGKLTVLHSFQGGSSDGAGPGASLTRDAAGNLYGTTGAGGDLSCGFASGCGTVFKLSSSNQETILFSGFDGYGVNGGGAGNIYGMAFSGGNRPPVKVWEVNKAGKETILHTFGDDTVYVAAGIIIDGAGNLYGVTDSEDYDVNDSLTSAGSVFKLTLEK